LTVIYVVYLKGADPISPQGVPDIELPDPIMDAAPTLSGRLRCLY
jgi:hypothetical protein